MSTLPDDIQKRAVAASAAIYRVSDIPTFDAVLKFELRRRSLEIMTGIAGLGVSPDWASGQANEGLRKQILAIQELIRFGRELHWIAESNADRIFEAYRRMQENLAGITRGVVESEDKSIEVRVKRPIVPEALYLNSRQDRILDYMREHEQAPISQICSLFGEAVSEKTIQRDLNELVSSGLIQRRGDNRWTMYLSIGH
jgi:hypothetical protein